MNNLDIFRKAVATFAQNSQIQNAEGWKLLMEHLCDKKILHPQQVKQINQNIEKRQFPITITQLQELIMRQFGDESNKSLLNDLNTIQKQIRQAKGVLGVWKQQGLNSSQIRALQVMFAKGNNKMKQICNLLQQKKDLLESISEQEVQMIKSMNQWTIMQKIQQQYANYQQYQKINQKAIDKLFAQLRVREVHFRTKKVPSAAYQKVSMLVGYNSKTDAPVQVTKIPKKFSNFQEINTTLLTFNAQRDLMLSPYFLRFLGYNNTADPHFYMYFRQHMETKNMEQLINSPNSLKIEQQMPIFQFWGGQIFRALRDIFYMSSYVPVLPIKLSDFEVADYGLKIIVKNCRFEASREPEYDIQCDLLQNVGMLLLALLGCQQISQIEHYVHNIENRCLITSLLRAKIGKQRYRQNIVPCYINFYNAQTHQLFESNQQKEGMEIIDNFTVLFSDQVL